MCAAARRASHSARPQRTARGPPPAPPLRCSCPAPAKGGGEGGDGAGRKGAGPSEGATPSPPPLPRAPPPPERPERGPRRRARGREMEKGRGGPAGPCGQWAGPLRPHTLRTSARGAAPTRGALAPPATRGRWRRGAVANRSLKPGARAGALPAPPEVTVPALVTWRGAGRWLWGLKTRVRPGMLGLGSLPRWFRPGLWSPGFELGGGPGTGSRFGYAAGVRRLR